MRGTVEKRKRKGRVVYAEIPQNLYVVIAKRAKLGKRSVAKEIQLIIEERLTGATPTPGA
jgi:hypothetical protein